MADPIDQENSATTGGKWLWIAIIALLAVVLLVVLFDPTGEGDERIGEEVVGVPVELPDAEPVEAGEPVTNPALLPTTAIGRPVQFGSVRVSRVMGKGAFDAAFTIGEGEAETLVMFAETALPSEIEQVMKGVQPGSTIRLQGELRSLRDLTLPPHVEAEYTNTTYIAAREVRTN